MAGYPPYQWRADGGYQELPPPPQAQPAPGMFLYPAQPMYLQPLQYMPGPIGVYGIALPPAPQEAATALPPAPSPQEKKEEKKEAKKDDDDKKRKVEPPRPAPEKKERQKPNNPRAPPSLLPGTNYMFPLETLTLHIFNPASKIWLPRYKHRALAFKIFHANTQKTVRQMIEYVKGAKASEGPEKCGRWTATECIEVGDGTFLKGTTIEYASDKAKSTFEECGWNGRRGQELPPVWIAVHKS